MLFIIVGILLLAGGYFAWQYYQKVFGANVELAQESAILLVPTGASFSQVVDSLQPSLEDTSSFIYTARKKSYPSFIKPGRYRIKNNWSNNQLVNTLRAGDQEPLDLVIHDISTVYDLSGFLGSKLEADSTAFLSYYTSAEKLAQHDLEPQMVMTVFIPNTYEFYWNSSPQFTLNRMRKEYERFWTTSRKNKAQQAKLTPMEVMTLASIVESETVRPDEMPRVAGLYMNRLQKGMRLQSDPTVIYGIKKDQPGKKIQRVLYRHLEYKSPYNTYLHTGLPPGPIKIPQIKAIEAVLNYEKHDYLYMAADPERPGYHSFAANLPAHRQNRDEYIRWLNRQERLKNQTP